MSKKVNILLHPLFLAGLVTLLLNDHVLKQQYHNTITGKLSDFAGLFIFPLFWSALFPQYRKIIYTVTALLFLYWKSTWSQPLLVLLQLWHLPITRVVDYTDLIALSVLPASYLFFDKASLHYGSKMLVTPVALISIIAFCATSAPQNFTPCDTQFYLNKSFKVKMSLEEVKKELNNLGMVYNIDTISQHVYKQSLNTDTSCLHPDSYLNPQPYFVIKDFIYNGDTINTIYISYYTFTNTGSFGKEQPMTTLTIRGYNVDKHHVTKENIGLYNNIRKRLDKLIKDGIVRPLKR